IRFYERKRILPVPKRAANRYRLYGDDAVGMLLFIMQATGLGLTLAEIKEIVDPPGRAPTVRPCASPVARQGR
ncbi:MAG: MerR family transcriptional regulator, partial [Solimonas sp.]